MTSSRYSFLLVLAVFFAPLAILADSFEAASVKLSANQNPVRGVGSLGPPIPFGPVAVLSIQHATLHGMLSRAYSVRYDAIIGPSWMESVYYDVTAKVAAGAGKQRIAEMLRDLLVQRFDLRLREETKTVSGWALVARTSSLKLQRTSLPDDPADSDPDGLASRRVSVRSNDGEQTVTMTGYSMMGLANALWSHLGDPVQDATGLKGAFDITIQGEIENPGEVLPRIAQASVRKSLRNCGLDVVRQKVELRNIRVEFANKNPKPN